MNGEDKPVETPEQELGTPIHEMDVRSLENLIFMLRTQRLKGLTVKEASLELGVSVRTVFRMMKDGKLEAEKRRLTQGIGEFWLINPISIAKILVRKEVEEEMREELRELQRFRALRRRRNRRRQGTQ